MIPWAKKIGEHRFRSPRNYERTLDYYRKTVLRSPHVVREKIINTSEVRAVHLRNKRSGSTWEGLNIYEYKGTTVIFVVFTDKELSKIADEEKTKASRKKKRRKKRKKKRGR